MYRRLAPVLAAALLASSARAQSAPAPSLVPTSSAQLAVLQVVVEDQDGHPVRGLQPQNFRITDAGVPQTLAHFEEHTSQSPASPAPALPPLPPGIFTDYTPIANNSTLNILLIDALNTPMNDRGFIRYQLQQYVKQANPNTRIAIFGLANRLILLQGFTSDPAVLRDVVERKLIARSSSLRSTPADSNAATNGSPSAITLAANLRQFESGMGAMETQLNAHYTLDAFNTLGHYLAAFPGRKNLIWFSGSFPLNLLPDPLLAHPNTDADELRETVNALSKAQVAVYPIDARALITQPASDATTPASQARRFKLDLSKINQTPAAEHASMEALAAGTGGRAFYNPSNLADAVTSAIAAGSNSYTLSYSPANPNADGSYRELHIDTPGVDPERHLQLFYRRGYYATAPSTNRAEAYMHAAMSRGAPPPEDLIFKLRVLPASADTETAVAPNNELSASVSSNGPFRRYDLDFLAPAAQLTLVPQPGAHPTAKVQFLAYVYDTEGRLLNATGTDLSLEARTSDYAELAHSVVRCHLEISVPDHVETFLRIGVRDVSTNKFGVIELPASTLNSLPPIPPAPASTPPAAPPSPAGRSTPPQV